MPNKTRLETLRKRATKYWHKGNQTTSRLDVDKFAHLILQDVYKLVDFNSHLETLELQTLIHDHFYNASTPL